MAKKDRTGNRKTREQRKQFKVLELGYYLIVTDTEATERCFFTGLHQTNAWNSLYTMHNTVFLGLCLIETKYKGLTRLLKKQ